MSSEVFDLIKFFWKHYNGKGFYLYLFLGCMVLLLFLRERRKYNRYLFWYCIGGLILYWIPYTESSTKSVHQYSTKTDNGYISFSLLKTKAEPYNLKRDTGKIPFHYNASRKI